MSNQNHQPGNAGQTPQTVTGRTNQESSTSRMAKSALDKAQEVGTDGRGHYYRSGQISVG